MKLLLVILNIFFVSFLDKPEKSAPALSQRALEQRAKWKIATDEMDYPVCRMYMDSICRMGAKLHHSSRWMNGATMEMTDSLANEVGKLKFVTDIEKTREDDAPGKVNTHRKMRAWETDYQDAANFTDEQLALYNLAPLHELGYEGQGILMAVCDGAFQNANTLTCFRQNELQKGHFDFTDEKYDFYGEKGSHGTQCLSTISGMCEGFKGAATKAQYYLMRSEENDTESPKEMDNLVVALETADSLGVNVFSVSLGYAKFDNEDWTLPKSALDGVSTRVSRAATIAARKGMLVCVAAGNEGSDSWHTISVPADADSVLTVGAVGVDSIIGAFSSFGPSADGRIKPEVCAVGVKTTLVRSSDGTIIRSNGTSYATPLLAGLAASLWSALPDENAMQIRKRIISSADRYDNPDENQYGYGIPDAWKAYKMGDEQSTELVQNMEIEQPSKIIRGEQILIFRHGHIYNLAGQRIE